MRRFSSQLAVIFAAVTMLSAVGLVATGGWLISSAALMPPILVLQVATVSVRFFGIARGTFRWAERVVSHDVALHEAVETRVKLWESAAILGPRGVWRFRGSDSLERITADAEVLQDRVTRVRTPFIAALLSAVILVIVQTINLPIAGLALAVAFIISGFVVPRLTFRIEMQVAHDAALVRNHMSSSLSTLVQHADELRVIGRTDNYIKQLAAIERRRIRIESRASRFTGMASFLNHLSSGVALFIALSFAISAYSSNALQGPMIAVVALLPWASAEIIATFSQAATANTRVSIAQERIDDFADQAKMRLKSFKPAREKILASPSELTVENLSVTWTDIPVVKDVSFTLRRGECLALVGPSGSGKSSVAAAVLRLVEHRGSVCLDEIPVERLTDFRIHVSALLQATHVFNMSVKENLFIANGRASDRAMVDALTRAGLSEWFGRLPQGLDTVIGQSGLPMSGGEAQRLGIARLLLSDAAFIILDEPTEHLDEETADEIWRTIKLAFTDRGLLVITHNESVADSCDYVLKLQNGQILNTLSQ